MTRRGNPKTRRRARERAITAAVTHKLLGEGFKLGDRVELRNNWRCAGEVVGWSAVFAQETTYRVAWDDGTEASVPESMIDHENPF